MTYKIIHKIGLSILIIGLINLYNILKKGLIINLPVNLNIINTNILKIEQNNIKIILLIVFLIFLIFYKNDNITNSRTEKIEYDLIIGIGLLGLIFLILSNDLILLFLGLELYSFSIFFLILVKETISLRRIAIYYFIISSLSSALLLFVFSKIYSIFGSLNIEYIYSMFKYIENNKDNNINYLIYLIILVFLFKLGTGPFLNWLIRVYLDLDKKILWYQLLIPKLVFFILILKFSYFISSNSFNLFTYTFFIFAIISIIFGSIGGLFQIKDNSLLSYSSILNIGYILLTFAILLINFEYYQLIYQLIDNNKIWIIYQYFIIYFINLIGLFSILFLYRRSSNITLFNSFFLQPFFFISFLIIIFSFIGLPPLSGFFSKFYLFFSFISFSTLSYYSLLLFIFSTLISSLYYFKFLFASSSSSILPNKNFNSILIFNEPNFYSFLLAFSTLFSIFYSFFLSILLPFFTLNFTF